MRDRGDLEVERGRIGSLALQISNAVGRLHKEFVGRGPTKVRTYIDDDLIVCLLEGGFTRAEQTIRAHSGEAMVIEMRMRLQAAMRSAIIDTVEGIVGRRVRSFMSANDPDQGLQVELMLMSATARDDGKSAQPEELRRRSEVAIEAARSLREDQAALTAEHRQAMKHVRERPSAAQGEGPLSG